MKKNLLLVVAAVLGLAYSAHAVIPVSQSFIVSDVRSVAVTNTISLTNLLSTTVTTNTTGLLYTNSAGTRVVFDGTNSVIANKNLCEDVDLWHPGADVVTYSDSANVNNTNAAYANIFIRILGTSGANSAVTFIFVPLPDGVHESTVAGDALSIAVTAAGATEVTSTTRVPASKWIGVPKIRLKSVTNADADATSRVDILNVSLNGWVP